MDSLNDTSTHKQERLVEKQSSNVASTYMYRGRAALERASFSLLCCFTGQGFYQVRLIGLASLSSV